MLHYCQRGVHSLGYLNMKQILCLQRICKSKNYIFHCISLRFPLGNATIFKYEQKSLYLDTYICNNGPKIGSTAIIGYTCLQLHEISNTYLWGSVSPAWHGKHTNWWNSGLPLQLNVGNFQLSHQNVMQVT